jgi:hypothetical protein
MLHDPRCPQRPGTGSRRRAPSPPPPPPPSLHAASTATHLPEPGLGVRRLLQQLLRRHASQGQLRWVRSRPHPARRRREPLRQRRRSQPLHVFGVRRNEFVTHPPKLEMLSGKKLSRRHQTREYRRLLRPQKDLSAFFGPLAVTIGLLSLVALAVGGAYTTGRNGVMPQYETSAVWRLNNPCLATRRVLARPCLAPPHLLLTSFSVPISAVLPSHLDTLHAPQHNTTGRQLPAAQLGGDLLEACKFYGRVSDQAFLSGWCVAATGLGWTDAETGGGWSRG